MKCFNYNKQHSRQCEKNQCRYWIDHKVSQNCCIVASEENLPINSEKYTLQDIGNMFKVTRMRICQIEKIAVKKLKDKFQNFS